MRGELMLPWSIILTVESFGMQESTPHLLDIYSLPHWGQSGRRCLFHCYNVHRVY